MHAHSAKAPVSNVRQFPSSQAEFKYVSKFQTPAERIVYSAMYILTKNGTESRRVTLDSLMPITGYDSQETIRKAVASLVRKKHITVLDRKGCRHYGILYRVQFPHEIRAMNLDPEYLEEQQRLNEERKKPKPKQQNLPLTADPEPVAPTETPAPETEKLGSQQGENAEAKNRKIRVTETEKLGSQNARILFHVLTCILTYMDIGGDIPTPARACMREPEADADAAIIQNIFLGETETPSSAAPEPLKPSLVPEPVTSQRKKSEGDKRHRMPCAKDAPETTALGKSLMVMLCWSDVVLDQRLKAELRRGVAWFTANKATAEEILEYKTWWWRSGRTRPPKLDWMIENFPCFRNEICPPEATGTPATRPADVPIHPVKPEPKLPPIKHSPYWIGVLERLQTLLEPEIVRAWFFGLDGVRQGNVTVITAPDCVFRDWITKNYLDLLETCDITNIEWIISAKERV